MRVVGYKPTSKKMSDRSGAFRAYIRRGIFRGQQPPKRCLVLFFQSHGWAPWDTLLRVPCSLFPLNFIYLSEVLLTITRSFSREFKRPNIGSTIAGTTR